MANIQEVLNDVYDPETGTLKTSGGGGGSGEGSPYASDTPIVLGDNSEMKIEWSTADADHHSSRIGLPNDPLETGGGLIFIGEQQDVIGTDLGIPPGDTVGIVLVQSGASVMAGIAPIDGVATILGIGTKVLQMLNPASGVVFSIASVAGETLFTGESGTNLALQSDLGIYMYGRVKEIQGTNVASATVVDLPNGGVGVGGNTFQLTGTTAVTLISAEDWDYGSTVTLIANENVTITNGSASSGTVSSGGDITIKLAGATNYTMTADDTLTLKLSQTTAGGDAWREVARSVN